MMNAQSVDAITPGTAASAGGPSPVDPKTADAATTNAKAKQELSRQALAAMLRPVSGRLMWARLLAAVSAVLAIIPYVALVWLGGILLDAWNAHTPPDSGAVRTAVVVLVTAFCVRLLTYFGALAVSHFADMKLRGILRTRIIDTLTRVPLAWFTSSTSGRIRKMVQDDTRSLHDLVAHAPVEKTSAIVTPLALFAYAMVIDWRLGLLTIAVFPIYMAFLYGIPVVDGSRHGGKDCRNGHPAGNGLCRHGRIYKRYYCG